LAVDGVAVQAWKRVKWEWTQGCTGRLYWCFINFEKAFDSVNREALWLKLRKIGVSENMINCIKIMYQDIKFCVKPNI